VPPNFYNAGDQAIYAAGDFFIPQERYRAAPYQPTNPDEVPAGIPTVYQPQGGGGGGGYTGGISDLTTDFFDITSNRQDRLAELNRPLQAAQFPSFPGAMTPGGYSANTMYNQALKDLNDPSLKGMSNDFVGKRAQDVMDYADNAIQDYRMQYATGELGPNYIPAEKPTLSRRINDFIYGLPFTPSKPQTAEMILNEGYNKPYGVAGPGILGAILGKMDNYHNLPVADQAFIAKNMGYTGPTVFGPNNSGLSKDVFGLNTRSARGNYAEAVGKQVDKLSDALSSTGAIGGKKDFQGATFNPATGEFESDELSPEQVAELNRRTNMVRAKYNFYTKQNQDYADTVNQAAQIQAAKDRDIVNKIGVTADDVASTTSKSSGGGGGGIASAAYGPGGGRDAASMGGGSRQAKSSGGAKTNRTDKGWGWADGGIVDMLEIYD
jgi:hypothetical protein